MDFHILKQAGIGPTDISRMVGVSRVTASGWLNNKFSPSRLLEDRLQKFIDVVKLALEAGELPVPQAVGRNGRAQYLQDVIDTHEADIILANY